MKIFDILKRKKINFEQMVEEWLEYKKMNIKKSQISFLSILFSTFS